MSSEKKIKKITKEETVKETVEYEDGTIVITTVSTISVPCGDENNPC